MTTEHEEQIEKLIEALKGWGDGSSLLANLIQEMYAENKRIKTGLKALVDVYGEDAVMILKKSEGGAE